MAGFSCPNYPNMTACISVHNKKPNLKLSVDMINICARKSSCHLLFWHPRWSFIFNPPRSVKIITDYELMSHGAFKYSCANVQIPDQRGRNFCTCTNFKYSLIFGLYYHHGPILLTGWILIPEWISNYIQYLLWGEITYPFPHFNGCTVESWEWISIFISHFSEHLITYPCWD